MALLETAKPVANTDTKNVVGTISGPYVNMIVETGLAATTPTYSLTDPDNPYLISGDANSDHYRLMDLAGTGAAYIAIRHLWVGAAAVRTTSTDPVVIAYTTYPNLNPAMRLNGKTRDVAIEYGVAYDRSASNAYSLTLSSATPIFVSSADYISASKDVLVDVTGAQSVILACQTRPIYSGNVSASYIQARIVSYS